MTSTILESLIQHLASLSFVKWVDIDEGQIDVPERPAVAFPCVLLEMGYTGCESISVKTQRVKAEIGLRVAFHPVGATNANAPTIVRQKSLARFDQLQELHRHLQGWKPDGCLIPLRRTKAMPEQREDGIRVYQFIYTTEVLD